MSQNAGFDIDIYTIFSSRLMFKETLAVGLRLKKL